MPIFALLALIIIWMFWSVDELVITQKINNSKHRMFPYYRNWFEKLKVYCYTVCTSFLWLYVVFTYVVNKN